MVAVIAVLPASDSDGAARKHGHADGAGGELGGGPATCGADSFDEPLTRPGLPCGAAVHQPQYTRGWSRELFDKPQACVGKQGKRQERKSALIEPAAQLRLADLVLGLAGTTVTQVGECLTERKIGVLGAAEHGGDSARAITAEPSGRVESDEPLALSLAGAGECPGLGLGQMKACGDRTPGVPFGYEREHAALLARELGKELADDQIVLVRQQRPLWIAAPGVLLLLVEHAGASALQDSATRSAVAVQAQCSQPNANPQRRAQMLFGLKAPGLFDESGGDGVVDIFDLRRASAATLAEASRQAQLPRPPPYEQLRYVDRTRPLRMAL
jgi:hypothetical protein